MNALGQIALQSLDGGGGPLVLDEGLFSRPEQCKRWRSNGFSNCEIYRLQSGQQTFAIRSWPNDVDTMSKVCYWDCLNASFAHTSEDLSTTGAAHKTPFPSLYRWGKQVDAPTMLFHFDKQLWTLSDWVDAESIPSKGVDRSLVNHLATVLGRLHARTRNVLNREGLPLGSHMMQSSSIRVRLNAIKSLDHRLFSAIDRSVFLSKENLSDRLKHCIATVFERREDWERFLRICVAQERQCHWIVRDLWRENVLLDRTGSFASIVDLGASRIDWPGLDFVRLFGSLEYDHPGMKTNRDALENDVGNQLDLAANKEDPRTDIWNDAYTAYTHANGEHSIVSLDECRMLHFVSSGLSVLQWAIWGTDGTLIDPQPAKATRIVNRISELSEQFLRLSATEDT